MLQSDLDRLSVWAFAWQTQYNVDKCEVIYFGSNNRKTDYYLNGCNFREVDTQRDLGVLVHQPLPFAPTPLALPHCTLGIARGPIWHIKAGNFQEASARATQPAALLKQLSRLGKSPIISHRTLCECGG